MAAGHSITITSNSNDTHGWACTCGDEADEFEDQDAAECSADEHLRHANDAV
jgi:hypothetical protein